MTRNYTLKKRAEQQAQTRQRIVEAAFDLHSSVGPAHTTLSMIAEKAGVQRHTLYAHFKDERSLFKACSSLHVKREPLPEIDAWRRINDIDQRLRVGLSELYEWYNRNAGVVGAVLRDAQVHDLTRETVAISIVPYINACRDVLAETLTKQQSVVLAVALSFHTWQTLVQEQGLRSAEAAEVMAGAIRCAMGPSQEQSRQG
jgi:AcrR family transcriptional regulator